MKKIGANKVVGLRSAAGTIFRIAGVRGFFQGKITSLFWFVPYFRLFWMLNTVPGLTARMLYQAPSTAVSWSVYEFFKYYLKLRQERVTRFRGISVIRYHTNPTKSGHFRQEESGEKGSPGDSSSSDLNSTYETLTNLKLKAQSETVVN